MFWQHNRYVKTAAESLGLTLKAHRGGSSSSSSSGSSHDRAGTVGEPLSESASAAGSVGEDEGREGGGDGGQGGGGSTGEAAIRRRQSPGAGGEGGGLSLWDGQRLVLNMVSRGDTIPYDCWGLGSPRRVRVADWEREEPGAYVVHCHQSTTCVLSLRIALGSCCPQLSPRPSTPHARTHAFLAHARLLPPPRPT